MNKFNYNGKINDNNYEQHREDINKYIKLQRQGKQSLPYVLSGFMKKYGKTSSQVYHAAFIDRQIFNKMLNFSNPGRGSKRTLFQVAVGLGLDRNETELLLSCCGHSVEPLVSEDCIFCYAIENSLSMTDVLKLADMEGVDLFSKKSTSANER